MMGQLLEKMSLKFAPDTPQEVLLDWLEEQGADSRVVRILRDERLGLEIYAAYWFDESAVPYAFSFSVKLKWPQPDKATLQWKMKDTVGILLQKRILELL